MAPSGPRIAGPGPRQSSTKHETIYGRRNFLAAAVATVQAAIGGTLAFFLGGSILSPSFARRQENWLAAGTLADLAENEPVPVAIRIVRDDGYMKAVDRQVVFLVKRSESTVDALSSVCTHLGCRVSWSAEGRELRCPCHGGVFDRHGAVKAGPPPAPLAKLRTRIDSGRILVQI